MYLWAVNGLSYFPADRTIDALFERLRPSLAILGDDRRTTGAAALVDSQKGLYLAHTDAVQGDTVQARIGEWRVSLKVQGEDERTGLVILALRSGSPANLGPALAVADTEPAPGTKVCILLSDRGLPATFVGGQQFMLRGTERKFALPSSEIRFEGSPELVGGSLVVSVDGRLIGAMGATVARPGRASSISLPTLNDVRRGLAGGMMRPQEFRPGSLTVAYSPTLVLFRRSVGGLVSDGHRPEYAGLGFQVGDAPGGGAVVKGIFPNTPASRSGIRVGDILLAMGDHPISRQYDFVQALLTFRPGDRTTLRIRHDGTESTVEVTLAKTQN